MYAVTIKPTNSIIFLGDRPEAGALWEVEEGVGLDLALNYDVWPEGTDCPEQVLCISTIDPKHYKLFKYARDIDRSAFSPTGKSFGGIYSKTSWKRLQERLPFEAAFASIGDDPSEAIDRPLHAVREVS